MSNVMRVSGLASGMDIESIISDLMTAERIPLDKMEQTRQRLEWQQEEYRTINTDLSVFREKLLNLKLQRTFNVKTAASSNTNVVDVTASGNALAGTSSISVKSLATGAFITGSVLESTEDFSSLNTQLGLTGEIDFKINGTDFTVNADTDSIYDLVSKINNADIGVHAAYDRNLDRLFFSTTETGKDAKIEIEGGDILFKALGIYSDTDTGKTVEGTDAEFTLNGADLTMSTNEFTINGITYTLKGVSAVDSEGNPVGTTVSVESDTEQIFQTIMDFVDLYNETIEKINGKVNEKYYRDYPPLTDTQREQLDDDQIEQWTEKAKSGLLRNDSILIGVVSGLRQDIYGFVDGLSSDCNSLSDLGITTGEYWEQGKLYVDEDKLREAIETDPEAVQKLFTATSDDDNDRNEGIAVKLYNDVLKGISQLTKKAGIESEFSLVDQSAIGKRLEDMDDRIEDMEDRLQNIEDRYWKKFTAMEQAINTMNSQSMWLSSYLGFGQQQ